MPASKPDGPSVNMSGYLSPNVYDGTRSLRAAEIALRRDEAKRLFEAASKHLSNPGFAPTNRK